MWSPSCRPEDSEGVVVNAKSPLVAAEGAVAVEKVELSRRDGEPLSRRIPGRMGLGAAHRVLGNVLETSIARVHLGESWTPRLRVPYPGRRGRDDLDYALEARRYVEALEVAPTRPVKYLVDTSDGHVTGDEIRAPAPTRP
jgi:hypothetical protein